MSYSLYVNMYSSIYFLTVLSVMRYLATVHPFRLLHVTSIRSAWVLCGIIWTLIMASSTVLLKNGSEQKGNVTSCLELNFNKIVKLQIMNYIALVVGFLLPFCTLSICYLLIIRALLKVEVPKSGLRVSHRKALVTIVIALIIFLLCFLPYHVLRTFHLVVWKVGACTDWLQKAVIITLALAAANSCLNPVLYYFAGENFKDRLRGWLGSMAKAHQEKADCKQLGATYFFTCIQEKKQTLSCPTQLAKVTSFLLEQLGQQPCSHPLMVPALLTSTAGANPNRSTPSAGGSGTGAINTWQ
ncbi:Cysteinyl leukotriene receptor 2 [Myotis davidii]|uniref:Cysteinyl leukotriene receptor 2 n=1 Tax=Myotis davidii TaxID=225400 RepID=L5LYC8_MYODS|nr:Cysteinyl leukotriene receptor 2 [Myotis davidii]